MKYDKIPENTFETIQLGAGVLLKEFAPDTGAVSNENIIGATTGGVTFAAVPSFTDYGDDIDNCPKNMLELKKLDSWDITMSGTFATVSAELAKMLVAAGDVAGNKITPRNDLSADDFNDIWWVGDYSDKNGVKNGGFIAVHMMNALSTGGFRAQTADRAKGTFSFEFTAHFSMNAQTVVPFEVYVKAGTAED